MSPRVDVQIQGGWSATGFCLLLFLGVLVGSPYTTLAQEEDLRAQRASTEQRLQQLRKQIQRDSTRLAKKRKAEQATEERLKSIRREIALREELLSTYQTRLQQLQRERDQLRDTLATLEQRLSDLREDYRRRLIHAYKYGRLHDLALLLASQSINQMLIRARYLQRFAADRQAQRSAIRTAAAGLRESREQLAERRAETRELLAQARTERQNLRALERDRRQVIDKLRAERSEIQEQIERRQKQAEQLEQRIQQLVARARRAERSESSAGEAEPPEEFTNLSAAFLKKQGDLPWPVNGAVEVGFGKQVDSDYQTTTYHLGIQIATNPESTVRAVFRGTVVGVDFVAGYGTYVVIRHGDYLSVYSNFSSLAITEDQRIRAGQILGKSGTESEPLGASLFFGVVDRSSSEFVDPIGWLSTR